MPIGLYRWEGASFVSLAFFPTSIAISLFVAIFQQPASALRSGRRRASARA
jgi:hypothetical protein